MKLFQFLTGDAPPISDDVLTPETRAALARWPRPDTLKVPGMRKYGFAPGITFLMTKEIPDKEKGKIILFLDLPVPLEEEDDEKIYGPFIKEGWRPFLMQPSTPIPYIWDFNEPLHSLEKVCLAALRSDKQRAAIHDLRRGIYQHTPYPGEPPS